MKNVFIQGSTHESMREVTLHMDADGTSSCEITLGVNDILVALDDVLSDVDEVSETDFQKLVNVAHDILAVEFLRDADRQCRNCDTQEACANCELFTKLNGHIPFGS